MSRAAVLFVVLPALALAQQWQNIQQSGTVAPYYTGWTQAVWDTQHQMLLVTQDDPAHRSGSYADAVFSFDPTLGQWSQLWVSDAASAACPGDTAVRPQHRHTYDQITWDTQRGQLYVTSGSCNGALDYDWYAFQHAGTDRSGLWIQAGAIATHPGNRQEAAMVYMPNVDRVMLYGGFAGPAGSTAADTWEYNITENAWTEVCASCPPGLRHGHIAVYDPPSEKVILFGGQRSYQGADIAETYLYDPTAPATARWTPALPLVEAPPASYVCHGYDLQRQRLLIYPSIGHVLAYTSFENAWTDLGIAAGPSPAGASDGAADVFCGYDVLHDWFVFFGESGLAGGPPPTAGIDFGSPFPNPVDAGTDGGLDAGVDAGLPFGGGFGGARGGPFGGGLGGGCGCDAAAAAPALALAALAWALRSRRRPSRR